MYNNRLKNNNLKSYSDLKKSLVDLMEPYFNYMSPGCARIDLGPPGATFNNKAVQLEGFARLLWGIIPLIRQDKNSKYVDFVIKGITNGTDPEHNEFWGIPEDYDQLLVEMAVFGYALLLVPDLIWEPLSSKAKNNFSSWLSYINKKQIPDCNWVFFRILVNCGLIKTGAGGYDKKLLEETLRLTDKFYIDENGWYNDGFPDQRRARDYYIPWALHYYGLIFAECCKDLYPDYSKKFLERASLFTDEYLYWFAEDGSALPYGRSLTYRFAQCAFWGALPFASKNNKDWGIIKRAFLQNLRWWFKQPAFSETGLLSVGYTYPNQYMAERYNSPNSPLWALKAYIPLAVSEEHPFWQTDEKPVKKEKDIFTQPGAGFIICDSKESGHMYALNSGQWTPGVSNEHLHMAEKYTKFAYSSYFGFNVTTDTYGIDKLAPDNMLLLSDGDDYYRCRKKTTEHKITDDFVYSKWSPFSDVEIETWLLPLKKGKWHARIHKIKSGRKLKSAEGGFPLPYEDSYYPLPDDDERKSVNQSSVSNNMGVSRIVNTGKKRDGLLVVSSPNSNICHPRVIIPVLTGEHEPGEFWLSCNVLAHPESNRDETAVNIKNKLNKLPEEVINNINSNGELE